MRRIIIICCLIAVSGCSYFKGKGDEVDQLTVEMLYEEARSKLDSGDYVKAVELYEKLEAKSPFGVYGQQAILDLAYVYYKSADYDSAISTADRFIKLHPQNAYVDYAYYLKGLANFQRGKGFTERVLPIDPSQRDSGSALQSFQNFAELRRRYPDSRYAEDAKLRMKYLLNILAKHEVNVARYYMRRDAYLAAINRARHVIEKYTRTPSVKEALLIMAKAYKIIGLTDLFADTVRVFELNYPNDPRIDEIKKIAVQ